MKNKSFLFQRQLICLRLCYADHKKSLTFWEICDENCDLEDERECDTSRCKFPFKFVGRVHSSCTDVMKQYTKYKPWCSTEVDEAGNHISGTWGNCDESCLSSRNGKESV